MKILPPETKKKLRDNILKFRQRHFDNYIFIHINKTGGSSIVKVLKLPFKHSPALKKREEVGQEKWDNSYKFAFVRNPWDKVVSHYSYRVQTNQTGLKDDSIDFKQWVKLAYGEQNPKYYDKPKMFMPQSDWITDDDGSLIIDFVGRFENINEDFNTVCQEIGKNKITLPHVKSSKRGNYREYYDDETIKIVEQWFSKDIERFGYRF